MGKYAGIIRQPTPVSRPIAGREQEMTKGRGGGFVFTVDEWTRLDRFLILGSDKNTYYADEQELSREAVVAVDLCITADFNRTIDRIVEISLAGRAPRNDAAIFALAYIAHKYQNSRPEVRQAAFAVVPQVARTASMFMDFQNTLKELGEKWNSSRRAMTRDWYLGKKPDRLAYQMLKYRNRHGWTNADLIKLGKFGASDIGVQDERTEQTDALLRYIIYGEPQPENLPDLVHQYEEVKSAATQKEANRLVEKFGLTWEFVPSQWLKSPNMWRVLLPNLPYTALLRNMARMTASGTMDDSDTRLRAASMLTNTIGIKASRSHPINILMALSTYKQGHGQRGNLKWEPQNIIADAMEEAFYLAFDSIEPSNKRILIGLDVSGSMWGWDCGGTFLNAAECAAAMSMSVMRAERDYTVMAFSHSLTDPHFGRNDSLGTVLSQMRKIPFGWTDCSLPIKWALQQNEAYDVIMILTDNETNRGDSVSETLANYRQKFGTETKFITASMVANSYSVADPNDAGMLDIVGFDSAMPQLVSEFAKGEF